jgi:hypothetical protein
MPLCSPFPGPLSVLIMDNACIHHGDEILELADQYGVRIEYLPPYSPDQNPIEEAFSQIKSFIWRNNNVFLSAEPHKIMYDLYVACFTSRRYGLLYTCWVFLVTEVFVQTLQTFKYKYYKFLNTKSVYKAIGMYDYTLLDFQCICAASCKTAISPCLNPISFKSRMTTNRSWFELVKPSTRADVFRYLVPIREFRKGNRVENCSFGLNQQ